MPEFQIGAAYVQFLTRGMDQVKDDINQVKDDINQVQAEADKSNRHTMQKQARNRQSPATAGQQQKPWQQNQRQTTASQSSSSPPTADKLQRQFGGDAYSRFQQQRQGNIDRMGKAEGRVDRDHTREQKQADRKREMREKEASRENEKTMARMRQMRQRQASQIENFRKAEERVDRQLHQERTAASNARRMGLLKAGAIARTAGGAIPGVGAAGDIMMAGAAGGPAGAAAMAVGKGINYGMEGAGKHSPATMERYQYQQDRLQGAIGSAFIPAIEKATQAFEWMGNKFGGKGYELAAPRIGGFEEMRDRLQMEALRQSPEVDKNAPGQKAMASWASPLGGLVKEAAGKDFSDAVDRFEKAVEENVATRTARQVITGDMIGLGRNVMSWLG